MKKIKDDVVTILILVISILIFVQFVRSCKSKPGDTYNGWHKDDPEMNRIK
ncbi:hypothetical protein MG290_01055 [Flavobacterium sp. CBA20B-1]|uniref:hypothetical protein n=1 Tax=unclassified Flavobacterium TaxID=196869 RepID=UPI00222508CA|nr:MULTISPECIES: hypothetical protein [unclassified Flavobacterium]WCM42289.1 hypothetical protein MG290_01055 [Flavobacterium sp. CBA20B-1]